MTIPSRLIAPYLTGQPVELHDGDNRRMLSSDAARVLAEQGKVSGKGSRWKLRYLVLETTWDDAQALLMNNRTPRDSKRSALSSDASKTITRDLIAGRQGYFSVYRHVYARCQEWPCARHHDESAA